VSGPATDDHLAALRRDIRAGLAGMPQQFLARQAAYIRDSQSDDGGWRGPGGVGDIYYTSFALQTAELLLLLDDALWQGVATYVERGAWAPADAVDCLCLLRVVALLERRCASACSACDAIRDRVLSALEAGRTHDGGFAKRPGGAPSVYHTYLAALCYGLLGRSLPGTADVVAMVGSRQRHSGGFADLPGDEGGPGAGINPTAAAVQLLAMCGALDTEKAEAAAGFVASAQRPDGGLGAWVGAPVSDLLSTFTGLVVLQQTHSLDRVSLAPVARFVRSLTGVEGGFRGTTYDQQADPEYTYYGLGAVGLLSAHAAGARQIDDDAR